MKIKGPSHLVEIAAFCAQMLNIGRFDLHIRQAKKLDQCSECIQYDDGTYELIVQAAIDYDSIIEHIAHEMVHLKQYKHDELFMRGDKYVWKGVEYPIGKPESDEYFLSPWEMEARAMESFLSHKWHSRKID